ncbi:hypothetical protein L484_012163 [Morus notabilis]|uniref:Uncharacterized protein n=1 Tax=Morus notabilis TaxID=981085 RepID=W9RW28_9ROSA|nr:hypothetical protein L484_012163 [Morus notabilis]
MSPSSLPHQSRRQLVRRRDIAAPAKRRPAICRADQREASSSSSSLQLVFSGDGQISNNRRDIFANFKRPLDSINDGDLRSVGWDDP